MVGPYTVFWYALVTAVATGLGAIPFLFFPNPSRRWLGLSNALAAGLMGAASSTLIYEGLARSTPRVLLGVLLGLVFIAGTQKLLHEHPDAQLGTLRGADATRGILIVAIMTVHSLSEGIGVGVSFGGGLALGLFITIAIAVQNIPEGLAISLVLVPKGEPVWRAAAWSVFSSLPQPILAVPAFLFVESFEPYLPVGLGFAAGAMFWMVFAEMIPEALEDAPRDAVALTITIGLVAMIAFQSLLSV
jgi:zinc transporter ZupT